MWWRSNINCRDSNGILISGPHGLFNPQILLWAKKNGLEQSGITLNEKVHFTLIGTISNYFELVPNDFGGWFINGSEAFGTVLKRSDLWLEVSVFFWYEIIAGNPVLSWHQLFVIQAGLAPTSNRSLEIIVPTRHVSLPRVGSAP